MKRVLPLLLIVGSCQAQVVLGTIVSAQPTASIASVVVNGVSATVKTGDSIGSFKVGAIVYDGVMLNGKLVQVTIGKPTPTPVARISESPSSTANIADGLSGNERFEAMIAKRIEKEKLAPPPSAK